MNAHITPGALVAALLSTLLLFAACVDDHPAPDDGDPTDAGVEVNNGEGPSDGGAESDGGVATSDGGTPQDDGSTSPDVPTEPDLCSGKDEESCAATPSCQPLHGTVYDLEQRCSLGRTYAGCRDTERFGCGNDAISTVVDPDGACWFFSSDCFPLDWRETSFDDQPCNYVTLEDFLGEACPTADCVDLTAEADCDAAGCTWFPVSIISVDEDGECGWEGAHRCFAEETPGVNNGISGLHYRQLDNGEYEVASVGSFNNSYEGWMMCPHPEYNPNDETDVPACGCVEY